jgi:type IV/VI secretion system ImpK/VasF family protein
MAEQPTTNLNERLQALFTAADDKSPALRQDLVQSQETYYRSRVFTAQAGKNELLNSAEPILCLLFHLAANHDEPELPAFTESLGHELKVFSSRMTHSGYTAEIMGFARYLLCASLDDQLAMLPEPSTPYPAFIKEFTQIHDRQAGDLHSFQVIEQLMGSAHKHREILEFVLVCLHAGFCQQQTHCPHNGILRDELISQLFATLKTQHTETDKPFFWQPHYGDLSHDHTTSNLALGWFGIFVASLLTSIGVFYFYLIDISSQPLLAQVQQIIQSWNGVG